MPADIFQLGRPVGKFIPADIGRHILFCLVSNVEIPGLCDYKVVAIKEICLTVNADGGTIGSNNLSLINLVVAGISILHPIQSTTKILPIQISSITVTSILTPILDIARRLG